MLYIDICEVLQRGRKPYLRDAYIKIANELGTRYISAPCKEASIIEILEPLLNNSNIRDIQKQYKCGSYSIDLYLPEKNIVIEINEDNHKYRNKTYEKFRQEFICDELQCYYHIIEPDSPTFSIPNMIKDIFKIIKIDKMKHK